jgi:hypothetical protein
MYFLYLFFVLRAVEVGRAGAHQGQCREGGTDGEDARLKEVFLQIVFGSTVKHIGETHRNFKWIRQTKPPVIKKCRGLGLSIELLDV